MDAYVPPNHFYTVHQKMTFHKYKVISPLDCSTLEFSFTAWILRSLENKAVTTLWGTLEMLPSFWIQTTKQEADTDFEVAIPPKSTDKEWHIVGLGMPPEFSKFFSYVNTLNSHVFYEAGTLVSLLTVEKTLT